MHKYLFPVIAVFVGASCRTIKPVEPHLPISTIDTAPLPDSRIDLPISIDLDSIIAGLNRKIPLALSFSSPSVDLSDQAHGSVDGFVKNPLIRAAVKKIVQPYWARLFQPVKVGEIGYLSMNPMEIRLEGFSGSVHKVSATLGVTARPVFSLTNPGPPSTIPPLPTISHDSSTGFSVYVDARIQYQALNDLLKARLDNKRMSLGHGGWVVIKHAELYGQGNHHLLVRVDFKGRLHADAWVGYRGRLYFTCLPVYDQASGELYVTELKFDTYTRENLLARAGNEILNSALGVFLNNELRFNLGAQINGVKSQLNTAINKPIAPNMNLSGAINGLSLLGLLPVRDCLLMRFTASGRVGIGYFDRKE